MPGRLQRAAVALVAAEAAAVVGGYYVFHGLNTDRAFRAAVGDVCPSCLGAFAHAVVALGRPLPEDLEAFRKKHPPN